MFTDVKHPPDGHQELENSVNIPGIQFFYELRESQKK
jgi:hypothetical protein